VAGWSTTQDRAVAEEQEVEAPTTQGAQVDPGSNAERAAQVPPAEPGDGPPALTEELAARIDEVTIAAEDAEWGLAKVVAQLPEGLRSGALDAIETSALVREGILDDEARLAETTAEQGGPLVDQVEQETKELADHTLWLDAWRDLGETTQRYRLFAVVTEGVLALVVAQGIGPELRAVCDTIDRIEAYRQRALNALRLAAKESIDLTWSEAFSVIEASLSTASAETVVGPILVHFGMQIAGWQKDAVLTCVFGEDDPESLASAAVSRAESVVGTTKDALMIGAAVSNLEALVTPESLDPVSDATDRAATAVGAAEHAAEAVSLVREYLRVCREAQAATADFERAKAQLAPLLSLAHDARDRQLAHLAEDLAASARLVADTESELGRYLGGGE
jgi:hypothetical protein